MYTFMIIDDEYFFRQSLKTLVDYNTYGFNFIGEANNGETGYELIHTLHPDLVFVDINMPVLDGLSLIEKCYEDESIHSRFILITGYSDFAYAKKALKYNVADYLLKPIDVKEFTHCIINLADTLKQRYHNEESIKNLQIHNRQLVKNRILNRLISGGIEKDDDLDLSTLKKLPYGYFTVALLHATKPLVAHDIEELDIAKTELYAFTTLTGSICILINLESKELLPHVIEQLHSRLSTRYSTFLKLSAGPVCSDVFEIESSYHNALMTLYTQVTYVPKICKESKETCPVLFGKNEVDELVATLENRDIDATLDSIHNIFVKGQKQESAYNDLAIAAINLSNTLVSSLTYQSKDSYTWVQREIIDMVLRKKNIDTIEEHLQGIAKEIMMSMPEEHISPITSQALTYVAKHYSQFDLSVKEISEKLHVNYSYLCAVFKNDIGDTPNHYIRDFRMTRAKELFDKGIMSVSFVALEVGYQDVSYFSKSFKKQFGESPKGYLYK